MKPTTCTIIKEGKKDLFKTEREDIGKIILSIRDKKVDNTTLKDHALQYLRDSITMLKGLQ